MRFDPYNHTKEILTLIEYNGYTYSRYWDDKAVFVSKYAYVQHNITLYKLTSSYIDFLED